MDIKAVERKWQSIWEKSKNIGYDPKSDKPKHYVLEMFSYPSGAKLHIGHWYNYGPTDSYARFKRMQGYNVFQPMGLKEHRDDGRSAARHGRHVRLVF